VGVLDVWTPVFYVRSFEGSIALGFLHVRSGFLTDHYVPPIIAIYSSKDINKYGSLDLVHPSYNQT
jgi:hypothetical protein